MIASAIRFLHLKPAHRETRAEIARNGGRYESETQSYPKRNSDGRKRAQQAARPRPFREDRERTALQPRTGKSACATNFSANEMRQVLLLRSEEHTSELQ